MKTYVSPHRGPQGLAPSEWTTLSHALRSSRTNTLSRLPGRAGRPPLRASAPAAPPVSTSDAITSVSTAPSTMPPPSVPTCFQLRHVSLHDLPSGTDFTAFWFPACLPEQEREPHRNRDYVALFPPACPACSMTWHVQELNSCILND